MEQSLEIEDPDGKFMVTAFDANHCPGAVMFLFEGIFGNILHTGDCRLTIECLRRLPEKYVGKKGREPRCPLDCVFLDCTFGKFPSRMPTKQSAIQQVINCIWKHPDAPTVYLTCDLLGQEDILVNISRTFGCKVYVDKVKTPQFFQTLELLVPEILSQDPISRFQMFDGFHGLYERAEAKIAEARANHQNEPLIIRASSQWYACGDKECSDMQKQKKERFDQAVRDTSGVWHVCYSIHSSREELEWALQILAPRWVVSTTPTCRAMELDYVKKHCFTRKRDMDDPFLKLLEIDVCASSQGIPKEASVTSVVTSEGNSKILTQLAVSPSRKVQHFSPPRRKRLPITLFGRARHGMVDPSFAEVNKASKVSDKNHASVEIKIDLSKSKESNDGLSENVTMEGEEISLELEMHNYKSEECNSTDDIKEHQRNVSDITPNGLSENVTLEGEEISLELEMHNYKSEECNSTDDIKEHQRNVSDITPNGLSENVTLEGEEISVELKMHNYKPEECNSTDDIKDHQRSVSDNTPNGSSKSFSASLRRLYRSMNVPVPEPLPSLVERMNANKKRARWLCNL
ncbi:unnamed protein product [Cuscuta epithymum]|uniref:DNA repair metallo-beta-lactamase domain-containing protein n=1 Tax=Cuscuta epithymum TaxID=186058 RepID=A0AAV0G4R9_9ASTE|nr:unnamed protein product [Cuscuta epithymum]